MSLSPSLDVQIDGLYQTLKPYYGGQRADYFLLLYLSRRFRLSANDIGHQVSFGPHDLGLDGYYIDRDARNLHLYQGKLSEDHNKFAGSMERMAEVGLDVVFGKAGHASVRNDMLEHLSRDLREMKNVVQRVYITFLFAGDVERANASEGLDYRRENLLHKAAVIKEYFGRDVDILVRFESFRGGKRIERELRSHPIRMDMHGERTHDGKKMILGVARLMDLYRIYQTEGLEFLERNIRAVLKPGTAPNRKIRGALKKIVLDRQLEPTAFIFNHNGMSLAASKIDCQDGELLLHGPKILNGAQTLSCIEKFLTENEHHRDLKRGRERLEELEVNIKIIEDDPSSDLVTDATIANNQQNPVRAAALRSMDKTQVDLADKFREQAGIFYARQEGSFPLLNEDKKEELGITSKKEIAMEQLAKTFLALQGELSVLSHISDLFESRETYERTFNRSYLAVDVRKLILIHKTSMRSRIVQRNLKAYIADGRSTDTTVRYQAAVDKGKGMVAALLIQGVLNDSRLALHMEDHGREITCNSGALNLLLDGIARTNVTPILKTLLRRDEYRQKLNAGKYGVLDTRESFKQAMKIAKDKFGWKTACL